MAHYAGITTTVYALPLRLRMPETATFPAAPRPRFSFTLTAETTLIQFHSTHKKLSCFQSQMMADNAADFAVKQYGGVRLDTQNIGSGTGGYFRYKIFGQLFCVVFFNLQQVICVFAAYHDC